MTLRNVRSQKGTDIYPLSIVLSSFKSQRLESSRKCPWIIQGQIQKSCSKRPFSHLIIEFCGLVTSLVDCLQPLDANSMRVDPDYTVATDHMTHEDSNMYYLLLCRKKACRSNGLNHKA